MPSRLTPCGLVEVNPDGVIVDVNGVLADWVGAPAVDLVGLALDAVLSIQVPTHSDDAPLSATATLQARSGAHLPVAVGTVDAHVAGNHAIAVFDLSPRSPHGHAFRSSGMRVERGLLRLQILLGASVGFAEARTEQQVSELLVDVAQRAFAATNASVHVRRDEYLEQIAGTNPLAEHWPVGFLPPGGTTVQRDEVLLVRTAGEALSHVSDAPMDEIFRAAGIHAALSAPIRYKTDALGALICYFDHPREFDDEAVPLAEALCNQAAQAIARVRLEENLRREAMHDVVTGLPGRRLIEEEVARTLVSADGGICVAFIDLDGFKKVNDRLGHAAGDALLAEVGRRLQATVRDTDLVGRYGGDEFIAVTSIEHEEDAPALAQRMLRALSQPYAGVPSDIRVSASIGVAVAMDTVDARFVFDRLVRSADHAMYNAKAEGGDRVELVRFAA